jgi:glycosyltransferase involved in cell wall biosynthesis
MIPTRNDGRLIDATLDSVLNQTYARDKLRIVFMDNCSDDGTYEKILSLIPKHRELLSVCKMKAPSKQAKVLKEFSAFTINSPGYYTVLLPGDIIYPSFVEKSVSVMHRHGEIGTVFANVDIKNRAGTAVRQTPIFEDNLFFDKQSEYILFFTAGIGAKVIAFYRYSGALFIEPLRSVVKRVYVNDWLSLAYPNSGKAAYLTESLGLIHDNQSTDVLFDMFSKLLSLKSQFYVTETPGNYLEESKKDGFEMEAAYYCMAKNALIEAAKAGLSGNIALKDELMDFSQIARLEIAGDESFALLKAAQTHTEYLSVSESLKHTGAKAPKHCFVF